MTGSLLPWWGWLLVAQGVLVLALFEYVRRNISVPATQPVVSDDGLREIAEQVVASFWRETGGAAIHDSVAAKLAVVEQDLFAHFDERLDSHIKQIAIQAGEFAGFKSETEKRLLGNDYAFAAIGHREVLLGRALKIEQGSESLDLGARGGNLAERQVWVNWEQDYKEWHQSLEEWLIFASPYWSNLSDIKKLPDNIHKLSWTFVDSQFLNSAAIHEYRSFCVIHHHWKEIKDKVHAAVRGVAFEGKMPLNAEV